MQQGRRKFPRQMQYLQYQGSTEYKKKAAVKKVRKNNIQQDLFIKVKYNNKQVQYTICD